MHRCDHLCLSRAHLCLSRAHLCLSRVNETGERRGESGRRGGRGQSLVQGVTRVSRPHPPTDTQTRTRSRRTCPPTPVCLSPSPGLAVSSGPVRAASAPMTVGEPTRRPFALPRVFPSPGSPQPLDFTKALARSGLRLRAGVSAPIGLSPISPVPSVTPARFVTHAPGQEGCRSSQSEPEERPRAPVPQRVQVEPDFGGNLWGCPDAVLASLNGLARLLSISRPCHQAS